MTLICRSCDRTGTASVSTGERAGGLVNKQDEEREMEVVERVVEVV